MPTATAVTASGADSTKAAPTITRPGRASSGSAAQATPADQPSDDGSARNSGIILSAADRADFLRLQMSLGGSSGIAVSSVGANQPVQRAGELDDVIAWSTSKVPVAMASIDAGQSGAQGANLIAAITASDNAAAMELWNALGAGQKAARATDAELRVSGDHQTSIQPDALLPGLTPFGQTVWSLPNQARFMAGMSCSAAGARVLALMGQIIPSERWGLGSAGVPFRLKGGWGPGSQPGQSGGYLDRQMGVLTIRETPVAIAIATLPANGSHETATRNLTAIARWAVKHVDITNAPRTVSC